MANAINWFEIPATDFTRAVAFYGKVLNTEMTLENIMGADMAFLPSEDHGVGGAIICGDGNVPSQEGPLVYLNGGEDLEIPLSRVEEAGGKVLLPKTKISDEIGYFAVFLDVEGNRLAFHSPK